MLLLILFLFSLSLVLFWIARQRRVASGLPAGRVIYSDTRTWGKVEKPLYDPELGLTGKPDYLVVTDGQVIPVEVKSSRAAEAPYDSHIYQLAAYCRLVEIEYGKRPPYGILHYANRTYAIEYTTELENTLRTQLAEMRALEAHKAIGRSHGSSARCQACGYRALCDQKLT